MLKHPFSKVLSISEARDEVWVLMMGHYTPDAIAALPQRIEAAAQSMGLLLKKDFMANLLYSGPDEIPLQWFAILPTGTLTNVYNVTDGRNEYRFTSPTMMFVEVMEVAEDFLKTGMKEDEAAFLCWKMIYDISQRTPQIAAFIRCFVEFERDVIALGKMLREQKMIPQKPPKRKKKIESDPYEELGLDRRNFF